jgi:hypothetical protein
MVLEYVYGDLWLTQIYHERLCVCIPRSVERAQEYVTRMEAAAEAMAGNC